MPNVLSKSCGVNINNDVHVNELLSRVLLTNFEHHYEGTVILCLYC